MSAVCLLASLAPALVAAPQDDAAAPPAAKVADFVTAVRDVQRLGPAAAPVLEKHAKTVSASTSVLLATIAQSVAKSKPAEGTDTAPAAIEPVVQRAANAATDLVRLRDRALDAIREFAADPANEDVKPVLAAAEMRIHVQLCVTAIRGFLKPDNSFSGTYAGMFSSLDKYDRDKIADAFLDIFKNPRQPTALRDLAGEGLAQMGEARHQDQVRAILQSPKETEQVRRRALFTLARLGDRSQVDRILENFAKRMKEVRKPEMTPAEVRAWADGYLQSAILAQNIHDTKAAIDYYKRFLAEILPIKEQLGANTGLTNTYYNLACLHSLSGDVEAGMSALDRAFAEGYSDFAWAGEDGDLANLRKDPRFAATVEKWKSGNGGAESRR